MQRKLVIVVLGTAMVITAILGLCWPQATFADNDNTSEMILPPTAPLSLRATFNGAGVKLEWLTSQAGSFPVKQYNIWRLGDNGDFTMVTSTDADTTTYTDPDGAAGDSYKVTAQDDQDPANVSADSDVAKAQASQDSTPANTLPKATTDPNTPVAAPPSGVAPQEVHVDNAKNLADQINQLGVHEQKNLDSAGADKLLHTGDVRVAQLDQAIVQNNKDLVPLILHQYTSEKQSLFKSYASLNPSQQKNARDTCDTQTNSLETSILNLPEAYQMDAIAALASCRLLTGQ